MHVTAASASNAAAIKAATRMPQNLASSYEIPSSIQNQSAGVIAVRASRVPHICSVRRDICA